LKQEKTLEALNFYKIDTFTIPADKEYYSYYKVNKIEGDKIIDLTEVQYQVIYKDQEVLLVNGIDYETGDGSIKGFTILELLIVITMMVLLSTVTLYVYINTIDGAKRIEKSNEEILQTCAALVQMEKQLFLFIKQKAVTSSLKRGDCHFILIIQCFMGGIVRAEYYVKQVDQKQLLVYEEYPYVDNKLGEDGLKKITLGSFDTLKLQAVDSFKGTTDNDIDNPTNIKGFRLEIDNKEYYVVFQ